VMTPALDAARARAAQNLLPVGPFSTGTYRRGITDIASGRTGDVAVSASTEHSNRVTAPATVDGFPHTVQEEAPPRRQPTTQDASSLGRRPSDRPVMPQATSRGRKR